MKKTISAVALVGALAITPAAVGSSSGSPCKPMKSSKSAYAACNKAINSAVDQLNAANGDKSAINPATACASASKKKDRKVRGGTPFALCVKAVKKFVASIPDNPGPPPSR